MTMIDRCTDAEPDEIVNMGSQAMSLRTAVRRWIEVCDTPGIRFPLITREVGKEPASFGPGDLDKLAEMERFR